jgi:hypothetical protein
VNRAIELWDEAGRNPARYVELLKKHGVLVFGKLRDIVPAEPQWRPSDRKSIVRYELGWSGIASLRRAAASRGASSAEIAAIDRLERFEAEAVDVERLEPLANLAGLPWRELFADIYGEVAS